MSFWMMGDLFTICCRWKYNRLCKGLPQKIDFKEHKIIAQTEKIA
jgi:hypothetical protein